MIKFKNLVIMCFVLSILLFSAGCEKSEKVISYDYTEYEGIVQVGGYLTKFSTTSTDSVEYYFSKDEYSEEETNKFIYEYEKIIKVIKNECNYAFDGKLKVYVSDKLLCYGNENNVYINSINDIDVNTITYTLKALNKSGTSYGLCYGLAGAINEKVFKKSIEQGLTTKEIVSFLSNDEERYMLDFTVPTLETTYFTEEENKYAGAISYYFVKDLIKNNDYKYVYELIKNSSNLDMQFDNNITSLKNDWLKSIGSDLECVALEVPIRYEKNYERDNTTFPYITYTNSTISYVSKTMVEPSIEVDMDYKYCQEYFTMYEKDIAELKDYLSPYFDTDLEPVECYFLEELDVNYSSSYIIQYTTPLYAGLHEYVHHITHKSGERRPFWLIDGLAEYCHYYNFKNLSSRMTKEIFYNDRLENKFVVQNNEIVCNYTNEELEKYLNCVNKLSKVIKNPDSIDKNYFFIELFVEINAINDYLNPESASTFASTYLFNEIGSNLTYPTAASMVNYLIDTYGEEKFFELYKDGYNYQELYGKSFEELYEEWEAYIKPYADIVKEAFEK
ncbi:hypothetical protein JYG23_02510 [Sedimentibacter sp. zth1]|uniref:hypothetical protein n=1 Tax=Sedimentibacter sp. zth1 TaxID=2816908 RepID=UPI001A938B50|nr:hypothetical protein [Sedimentibacter sp. zth1]QSX06351.1 hypothetical protein JYG23_02510 [Sedimentibacter sp. zth1]